MRTAQTTLADVIDLHARIQSNDLGGKDFHTAACEYHEMCDELIRLGVLREARPEEMRGTRRHDLRA